MPSTSGSRNWSRKRTSLERIHLHVNSWARREAAASRVSHLAFGGAASCVVGPQPLPRVACPGRPSVPSSGRMRIRMAIKHRPSAEIREFLAFYLLELISAGPFRPAELGEQVARESKGDLRPAEADLRAAQVACWEGGWMECDNPFSDRPASLSAQGRVQLARLRRAAGKSCASAEPRQQAADVLISRLPPPNGEEVLDVGTGDGFLALKLGEAGFRVLGIDTDADAIARARRQSAALESRVRFQVGEIHEFARSGLRFPKVVTSYLLHECDDPFDVLEAICACLAPGGALACMDFAANTAAYLSGVGCTPFHPFRALAKGDWQHLAPRLGLGDGEYSITGYVAVATAINTGDAVSGRAAEKRRNSR